MIVQNSIRQFKMRLAAYSLFISTQCDVFLNRAFHKTSQPIGTASDNISRRLLNYFRASGIRSGHTGCLQSYMISNGATASQRRIFSFLCLLIKESQNLVTLLQNPLNRCHVHRSSQKRTTQTWRSQRRHKMAVFYQEINWIMPNQKKVPTSPQYLFLLSGRQNPRHHRTKISSKTTRLFQTRLQTTLKQFFLGSCCCLLPSSNYMCATIGQNMCKYMYHVIAIY